MKSEFDAYAANYKELINRGASITGESFEYFIGLRVKLVLRDLGKVSGDPTPIDVLDFGCGIGETERVLREKLPGATLHGVDPSAESLKAARALNVAGATFHEVESAQLPFDDASFDLVYSNGTFHHIDHAEHVANVREITRVLRPGGSAFIFENNPLNPVMVHNMRNQPLDPDAKMLWPGYLRRVMGKAGLRTLSPRFYVFFPKQLKAVRFVEPYLERVPFGAQYYVSGLKPA
jgi:ubiquinone/menaquinone biosynthesis C-methylase UbiE